MDSASQRALQARTEARPATAASAPGQALAPAQRQPAAAPAHLEELALAREAAKRCACVIAGFFTIDPADLFKATRGSAEQAFPRQLLMAGLVVELGFSPKIAGLAVERDPATVEHACRIVEAIRGGLDPDHLDDILGADAVDELGGPDGVGEFLEHAEDLIDELFRAFALVAVRGGAYSREIARRKRERMEQAR